MSNSSTPTIMIYPMPIAGKQPPAQIQSQTQPPPSHHSNGSFGTVFIVLAIITVISGIACFIGRFTNKRTLKHQSQKQKHPRQAEGSPPSPYPNPHSNDQRPNHERDMELGYPGSHQPGTGPMDFSDSDFDKRSKSSNSKPQLNGVGSEGMRGPGISPSTFGPRKPDQVHSDDNH